MARSLMTVTGVVAIVLLGAASGEVDDPPKPDQTADAAPKPEPAGPVTATTEIPDLIAAHNAVRKEHGLGALEPDPLLAEAAKRHAIDMAERQEMSHEGGDGSTPGDRVRRTGYLMQRSGENIAMGYDEVGPVMDGWLNSPPHRANILGDFTQIGVARAKAGDGAPYWAVEFGTPWPETAVEVAKTNLLDDLNRHRKEAKKSSIRIAPKLDAAAQRHASDNASRKELASRDTDNVEPLSRVQKSGYRYRRLGLADASGYATAREVLDSWLEQPNQRENLLGAFSEAGIGYARDTTGKPYWTLILAQPSR